MRRPNSTLSATFTLLAFLAAGSAPSVVAAQAAPDNSAGYDWAMRCFVAGAAAMPKPAEDPNGTVTQANRAHARKAFDAVYFLGGKLGYSESKISADLDRAQAVEMRLMVQNRDYFEQSKASCIKLGLM